MRFIVDCAKFSEQRFYSAPPTTVSVFSSLKLGPTESSSEESLKLFWSLRC